MAQSLIKYFLFLSVFQNTFSVSAGEVSLKEDLNEIEKLRDSIPEQKRQENDELAFVLKLFEDLKRNPQTIQQEFNRRMTRERETQKKKWQKASQDYTSQEKTRRSQFLDSKKEARKNFLKSKPPREESTRFFAEERASHDAFFAEERSKRRDFQSDQDADRRSFDENLRDRRKQFEDKLREFKELQKAEKNRKSEFGQKVKKDNLAQEHQNYLHDFEKIPETPGAKLAPKEEE